MTDTFNSILFCGRKKAILFHKLCTIDFVDFFSYTKFQLQIKLWGSYIEQSKISQQSPHASVGQFTLVYSTHPSPSRSKWMTGWLILVATKKLKNRPLSDFPINTKWAKRLRPTAISSVKRQCTLFHKHRQPGRSEFFCSCSFDETVLVVTCLALGSQNAPSRHHQG